MRFSFTLLLAVFTLGCISAPPNPGCKDGNGLCGTNATPDNKKSCEAAGGIWGRIGLIQEERCNLLTRDVGKTCSGQGECEGACIADLTEDEKEKAATGVLHKNGTCTAWRIVTGCQAMVEDGKVMGVVCLD